MTQPRQKTQADKIYGHAAPDRMHQRDKLDDDPVVGTRARKLASQPTLDAKKRRTRGQGPKQGN